MADIEVHRLHDLGLAGARAAAERMAEHLGRKFDLKGTWQGNVLRFERPGVTGSLAISERDMKLSVALGFLLKAMKGSIESAVVHEVDKLFAGQGGGGGPARATARPAAKAKKPPASRKKGR